MKQRFVLLSLILSAAFAPNLSAQDVPTWQRAKPIIRLEERDTPIRENLISINPLGIVFEYFSGEFEHATTRSTSLALSASYASPFDISYNSIDLIGRFYPAELGLRGFSIGPTVGYTHVRDNYTCYGSCSASTSNALTAGVQLDYGWILGPSQHFGIELGIGAKRLFYQGQKGKGSDALPTGRLSVGYAF